MKGAVKCPYHAWSYSFEGKLIGTPNVGKDEVDRDALGLWPVSLETWQGFLFVHLDPSRRRSRMRSLTSPTRRSRSPASTSKTSASATGRWSRSRPTGRS